MKRISVLVTVVMLSMLFTCSAWADRHHKVADVGPGTLHMGAGSVRIVFGTNPNGTLKGVLSGSIPVFATEVEAILFSSQRMGYREYSHVQAPLAGNVANITGLANNDEGTYFARLTNGKLYKVDVESMSVTTATPMFYELEKARMSFGEFKETRMTATLASDGTITLAGQFGCNIPVGVRDLVNSQGLLAVNFVATDGATYAGQVTKDESGNLLFSISGIVLASPDPYNPYMSKLVTGKLFAVMTDGSQHQFEFNSRADEQTYVWWVNSWADLNGGSIWTEYLEASDSVKITYWAPYTPPAPPTL